jgi:hypothetical protein
METKTPDRPAKGAGRGHLQMQNIFNRTRVRPTFYSFEMNSFSDSDASVEAKMMAATASRPMT